jgi:uncharacterized protein YcnI
MRSMATTTRWVPRLLAAMICAYLLSIATPALAHVTITPGRATAGEQATIALRVPHGCDGSSTTAISVQIPDTVASVTPQYLADWTVDTTMGPLAEPVELHGETVSEGIREVTWSGGPAIPDGLYFDFGLSVRMPDAAGEALYFPIVQTCERGEMQWIEIPAQGEDDHDLEAPAPAVELVEAGATAGAAAASEEGASEAAMASEPVATAQLATARDDAGGSGLMVTAVIVALLALAVLVGVLVAGRLRRG